MHSLLTAAAIGGLLSAATALTLPQSASTCASKDIVSINDLLKKAPQPASQFCSFYLQISTPIPNTVTVTQQITTTSTGTSTTVTTTTDTSVVVVAETITSVSTSVVPGSTATTSTTATSYVAPPVMKKRDELNARGGNPPTPSALISCAKAVASQACSCFLGLPRPTTTLTSVSTVAATALTTSTAVEHATITTTSTATELTTTTSTSPPSTTTIVSVTTVNVNYEKKYDQPRCAYNRYYSAPQAGSLAECESFCTGDPRCKFFAFSKFDPEFARGSDGTECDLDDQPYDPALIQCGYVTASFKAYDKISV